MSLASSGIRDPAVGSETTEPKKADGVGKHRSRQYAREMVRQFAREMVSEGMELVEIEFEMSLIARDSMIDWYAGEEMQQQDTKWVEKMVKEEWEIEVENAGAACTEEAGDSEIEVQLAAELAAAEVELAAARRDTAAEAMAVEVAVVRREEAEAAASSVW